MQHALRCLPGCLICTGLWQGPYLVRLITSPSTPDACTVCWQDYRERVLRHEAAHFLCSPATNPLHDSGCMHARKWCLTYCCAVDYLHGICLWNGLYVAVLMSFGIPGSE